jgi:hypothetical protein
MVHISHAALNNAEGYGLDGWRSTHRKVKQTEQKSGAAHGEQTAA